MSAVNFCPIKSRSNHLIPRYSLEIQVVKVKVFSEKPMKIGERPINDFYLGKKFITQAQYALFLIDQGKLFSARESEKENYLYSRVDKFNAEAFCHWIGLGARLPTKFEIEFAAKTMQDIILFPKKEGKDFIEEWLFDTGNDDEYFFRGTTAFGGQFIGFESFYEPHCFRLAWDA